MKGEEKKWSKTIHLPQTEFPMRAELARREPSIIEFWRESQAYTRLLEERKDSPKKFILHDGPPYANGRFHVGHALNKILKDIINKYHLLLGAYVNYIPGWDCHGLPIELAVMKKLSNKKDGSSKDPNLIRKACREYALEYMKLQAQDQTRMGVFWDDAGVEELSIDQKTEPENIYYTMSRGFESAIIETFRDLFQKGLIYKGKKPIHWCPSCATALAEAEVEYAEHTSNSIYVKFPVQSMDNTFVIIWTTTPWTLPANLGVCFHPDFEYAVYETVQGNLIIASGLEEKFFEETGLSSSKRVKKVITQEEIKKLEAAHPFLERKSKVIFGEHVTLEAGTGIVHTAPGHGHDDYIIGQKYGLDILSPVDHRGRYTKEYPEMEGVKVFEANEKIIEKLKSLNVLIHTEKFQHSYPHCWRCRKPLIFRATPQWFLSVEKLKEKALKEVKEVEWIPHWGQTRFESTIQNRPDWCLSRQRFWGVPIPAFGCSHCGRSYLNEQSLNTIVEKVKEKGIEVWYQEDAASLLPEGATCEECGSNEFHKENDILDVWFDSGVTWRALLKRREDLSFPCDMYLEGSGQHRGWFQSSLWPSLALEGCAPYRQVLTHGYILDEKGRAMSKSLGNVISPAQDIIPKYGADVLRLWVSSEDYRADNTIGFKILDQLSDSYRKIRNTFRYLLGNLQDGKLAPELDNNSVTDELDLWILDRLGTLGQEMKEAYKKYEFHTAYQKALRFCTLDLSHIYFDIIRDRLYCNSRPETNGSDEPPEQGKGMWSVFEWKKRRLSSLQTLSIILRNLNVWLAPILSFTMEEVYQLIQKNMDENASSKGAQNGTQNHKKSVFEEIWPEASGWQNETLRKKFAPLWELKDQVNIKLEEARNQKKIGSSVDASVYLSGSEPDDFSLETLAEYLVVSEVVLSELKEDKLNGIQVEALRKEKCPRCWLRREATSTGLCTRCSEVVG